MQKISRGGCVLVLMTLAAAACSAPVAQSLDGDTNPKKNGDANGTSDNGDNGDNGANAQQPNNNNTPTQGPAIPGAFKKGDAFDYAKAPVQTQMIATMLKSFGYAGSTAPRAVAVNVDGLGFVAVKPTASQQSEAEQTALQACYVIGGAKPCVLLATASTFAVDAADLAKPTFVLDPLAATLANVPFALAADAKTALQHYADIPGHKAIAVSVDGTVIPAPTASGVVAATDAEASHIALETCEMQALMAPCTLFAIGASVVFNPKNPNANMQVPYANTTVNEEVPGLSAAMFTSAIEADYLKNVKAGKQGALFISRDGNGGYAYGPAMAAAQTTAKANCAQHAKSPDDCVMYATGASVVFKPSSIVAFAVGGQDLTCNATPRFDCTQHTSIGCASGGHYYTTHAGAVKLEDCP